MWRRDSGRKTAAKMRHAPAWSTCGFSAASFGLSALRHECHDLAFARSARWRLGGDQATDARAEPEALPLHDAHSERNPRQVASLLECVHAHADLEARRTAACRAQAADAIDALIAAQQALSWPAP